MTSYLKTPLAAALAAMLAAPAFAQEYTEANWLEKTVGFKPDAAALGGLKAGDVIDKTNLDKHRDVVPGAVQILVEKYGLKLPIRDYQPLLVSKGYIDATNKYSKGVKLIDVGGSSTKKGIEGYVAGLPFPNPKNGTEIAHNLVNQYDGDNAEADFMIHWVSLKRGLERVQRWNWLRERRAINRTDLEPMPAIPEYQRQNIRAASLLTAKEPFDVSGVRQLLYSYDDPSDGAKWIYIPSLRRTRQFAFGLRGDVFNSTDLFTEDAEGYNGYVEWQNWTLLGKKTMLGPFNVDIPENPDGFKQLVDMNTAPYIAFNTTWQPRPVYVVEATSKFEHYPYGRMVFYIDAETNHVFAKEAYDKSGKLWKTLLFAFNQKEKGVPLGQRMVHVVDHRIEHATIFHLWGWRYNNPELKPSNFSLTTLRVREGRGS